ncbi:MAG TPA: GNAT family N-acetyltransferase [Methylocystis sp.]|nr:GNAT family N-acetyltransferase [Methylocystis sp.]
MKMTNAASCGLRCREIAPADLPALAELLAKGFPRPLSFWTAALDALARRDAPESYPRFGFLLEREGRPVGTLLTIYTRVPGAGERMRCNISSWYVDPDWRAGGYASALIAAALRYRNVTYVNISPAPHTWRTIEAQGFRRFCEGQMICVPALKDLFSKTKVSVFDPAADYGASLSGFERNLLAAHQSYGCLALVVRDEGGVHPFIFATRRAFGGRLPVAQLVYCRDQADFARFSGPLGRALARRGRPLVLLDCDNAIPGLLGVFRANRGPKYFKGPDRPRLGDLAFCEFVLFGF